MAKPGPTPDVTRIFAAAYAVAICEWSLRRHARTAEVAQIMQGLLPDTGEWTTSRALPPLMQALDAGLITRHEPGSKIALWSVNISQLNMNTLTNYLVSRLE